ncbi:MAG: hypothetical protein IJJ90_02615 [Prevotella sp.]|nr:hypothetical protein [Prevotella sp.]
MQHLPATEEQNGKIARKRNGCWLTGAITI